MINRDCYYYYNDHDMGATIPCCRLDKEYRSLHCENCPRYITQKEVDEIVMEFKNGNYIRVAVSGGK